jgi:hypothetical protein
MDGTEGAANNHARPLRRREGVHRLDIQPHPEARRPVHRDAGF